MAAEPHEPALGSRCTNSNRDTRSTVAVIQPALDIPDDVALRLLTGEYVRAGGVVRDHAGRLVKLLDDASPIDDAQEAAQASIAKILRNRQGVLTWARRLRSRCDRRRGGIPSHAKVEGPSAGVADVRRELQRFVGCLP